MTTDTVDKQATADAGPARVGGCAKGVGMISPNLATMLVFITTDAAVAAPDLQRLAEQELKPRFNALTVDACTSTNDTVLLFASGAAGEPLVAPGSPAWPALADAVAEVGESLLRQLAADAEGVHHVLLIDVTGAASEGDARARGEGRGRFAAGEDGGVRRRPQPGPDPAGGRRVRRGGGPRPDRHRAG